MELRSKKRITVPFILFAWWIATYFWEIVILEWFRDASRKISK